MNKNLSPETLRRAFAGALSMAINGNDLAKVNEYLASPILDINESDEYGRLPIMTAISLNKIDIMLMLLKAGADVNSYGRCGDTPLHFACRIGNTEAINLLLKKGARINAISHINVSSEALKECPGYSLTPLHYAAINGHFDAVKLLLDNGAKVNITTLGRSNSPLQYLYRHENESHIKKLEIMKLLLESGASEVLNNKDTTGKYYTLLHKAAKNGDVDAVKLFLAYGAEVNTIDTQGKTPLHYAVTSLKASCQSNVRSSSINDDEFSISQNDNLNVIEALLSYGADPSICEASKATLREILDISNLCNCFDVIQMLKRHGLLE